MINNPPLKYKVEQSNALAAWDTLHMKHAEMAERQNKQAKEHEWMW